MRRPLGVVIAGGLIASQLLTLFTTPVVYLVIDALSQRLTRLNADSVPTVSCSRRLAPPGLLLIGSSSRGGAVTTPGVTLPQIDFPVIEVQAQLPGASPQTMAATVATPLERRSGSSRGERDALCQQYRATEVQLEFDLDSGY